MVDTGNPKWPYRNLVPDVQVLQEVFEVAPCCICAVSTFQPTLRWFRL